MGSQQKVLAGFHACNVNALTGRDRDILRMTEAGCVTFLTDGSFTTDDVKWMLSINPNCHFFLREYFDPNRIGDRHDRSTWDYTCLAKYYNECRETLVKYVPHIPQGQLHFQFFNEQNMPTWAQWEGFGDTPDDMKQFNMCFVTAVQHLRLYFPNVKYGLTPLTPGNRDVWFEGDQWNAHYYLHGSEAAIPNASQGEIWAARESCLCKEAIEIADEYYFHIYVHETHDPAGKYIAVNHPAYGLRYLTFLRFLPEKPFWILECGYPNESMWITDARLLDWFKLLDRQVCRPDGVTFWVLGEKEDWGNVFSPGGVIRPFVYDLKKYLNEREEIDQGASLPPSPLPPHPTEIEILSQHDAFNAAQFKTYLNHTEPFAEIKEVFIHHTVNPTPETWRGRDSMLAMKRVYEKKGWTAGPHVFVMSNGVWIFTPVNEQGIGVKGHNAHAIHVEIVGNYEENKLEGAMLRNAIDTFTAICDWLQYDPMSLRLHRDYADTKCPGKFIGNWFRIAVLNNALLHEAAKRIGTEPIRVNETAALYRCAHKMQYGAPLTNEFALCNRYVAQGFATCILSCVKGDWENITTTMW